MDEAVLEERCRAWVAQLKNMDPGGDATVTSLKAFVKIQLQLSSYKGGGYEYAVQFETRNPPRGDGWSMYREIENDDYRNDGAPRDLFVWRRKMTDEQSKNET